LKLSIREEPVLPRRQGCAANVPGGMLLLMAKGVTEKIEAKLTYRVKYSTKDGPRQTSSAYIVSLFPLIKNVATPARRCLLLEVKRTSVGCCEMSAFGTKRAFRAFPQSAVSPAFPEPSPGKQRHRKISMTIALPVRL